MFKKMLFTLLLGTSVTLPAVAASGAIQENLDALSELVSQKLGKKVTMSWAKKTMSIKNGTCKDYAQVEGIARSTYDYVIQSNDNDRELNVRLMQVIMIFASDKMKEMKCQ